MREITEFQQFRTEIVNRHTIHIFGLGFEERCLKFPQVLRDSRPSAGSQTFFCVDPGDWNLASSLKTQRSAYTHEIQKMLPSARICSLAEPLAEIGSRETPDYFCVDVSTLPRTYIFKVLEAIFRKTNGRVPTFVIYTYPKTYAYGQLQDPASEMNLVYDAPALPRGKRATMIMLPGFDVEYTNLAISYAKAVTGQDSTLRWLFSFPGRRYQFYERALESHLELIEHETPVLFPQNEIRPAFERLLKELTSSKDRPVFCVPLGCRLTCVPVFLAAWCARRSREDVNLLFPKTRRYNSIRSGGGDVPLIEQLPTLDGK
jgi:hypothetical protein